MLYSGNAGAWASGGGGLASAGRGRGTVCRDLHPGPGAMDVNLKRLETALERAVEGAFERVLPGSLHRLELYEALWQALADGRHESGDATIAPNRLSVFLHPDDLVALADVPVAGDGSLEQRLEDEARRRKWNFGAKVLVCVRGDAEARPGAARVAVRVDDTPVPAGLLVESGPVAGDALKLFSGAVIGRGPECSLTLADSAASSKHCRLDWTFEGYRVTDLGSTNGTFVNDVRVTDYTLSDGQVVTAGLSKLRFNYDFAAARASCP